MKIDAHAVVKMAIVAVAAVGMIYAPAAKACGVQPGSGLLLSGLLSPGQLQARPAFGDAVSASPGEQAREDGGSGQKRTLVGMWTVNFFVSGQLWDVAIEQFFADGNEMTNDIAFPPSLGNICWGVWERVSDRVYKMKHIGWTFDANGAYAGRFDFKATLVLGKGGEGFTGKFVADQEDLSGNFIPDQHAEGTLEGARFSIR